ncbi:MAG TPA: hypothetical protein VF792_11715 [Ktedonobacterales bacterium]
MNNRIVLGIGGGLLLAVGLMIGVILGPSLQALANGSHASAATANPAADPYCQLYEQTVMHDLGVSQSQLESANKDGMQAVINKLYADKKITQAQKAQAEQQLSQYASNPCVALKTLGKHGAGAGFGGPNNTAAFGAARTAVVSAVASALHLTPATLEADLNNHQTIAQITTAQGVSKSSVDDAYLSAVKSQLATAVSKNELTQAQSDMAYSALQQAVANGRYPLLDGKGGADGMSFPAGMPSGMIGG